MHITLQKGSRRGIIFMTSMVVLIGIILLVARSPASWKKHLEPTRGSIGSQNDSKHSIKKDEIATYVHDEWGISFSYPAYLRVVDSENGYPTCHGDGPDAETKTSPWACSLRIYDPTNPENAQSLRSSFLTLSTWFDDSIDELVVRPGSQSGVVSVEEIRFRNHPARRTRVFIDASQKVLRSLSYDVLFATGQLMTVEAIFTPDSVQLEEAEKIIASIELREDGAKPSRLYEK